jgi:hypothetical protein
MIVKAETATVLAHSSSPVSRAALISLLDDVVAVEQVSAAFVLVGAWWSRGAEPASTPAVLDGGLSQFWFSTVGSDGTEAVFVWHDYSLLDQTIELSVALGCPSGELGWARFIGPLEEQCDHVGRSVHVRRVIARVVAGAGSPHPAFRLDGTVPRMITDCEGICHDVDFLSADPCEITGDNR